MPAAGAVIDVSWILCAFTYLSFFRARGRRPWGETPRVADTCRQAQASYVAGSPVPLPLPPGPPVRLLQFPSVLRPLAAVCSVRGKKALLAQRLHSD